MTMEGAVGIRGLMRVSCTRFVLYGFTSKVARLRFGSLQQTWPRGACTARAGSSPKEKRDVDDARTHL